MTVAPDKVMFLTVPDHLGAAHAAERAQGGQKVDGFQDVGFALGVVAEQEVEAGCKIHIDPPVIAEVA